MYEKVEIWDALCFKITVKLFDLLKKDKISSKKFRRASHAYISKSTTLHIQIKLFPLSNLKTCCKYQYSICIGVTVKVPNLEQ